MDLDGGLPACEQLYRLGSDSLETKATVKRNRRLRCNSDFDVTHSGEKPRLVLVVLEERIVLVVVWAMSVEVFGKDSLSSTVSIRQL